jgi:AcrR family transcriptional regulator
MADVPSFLDDPSDTRGAIMAATFRALSTHGYADLTIQGIGDEFEKSKSLLYHHYDGKDELLLDFLEFMLDRFEESVPPAEPDAPDELLDAILDHVLLAADDGDFFGAMVELRAQAAHDPAYREHFTKSDASHREGLADLVRSGVEEGVFRDVDPEATATFIHTTVLGAMVQRATADGFVGRTVRDELDAYLRSELLVA